MHVFILSIPRVALRVWALLFAFGFCLLPMGIYAAFGRNMYKCAGFKTLVQSRKTFDVKSSIGKMKQLAGFLSSTTYRTVPQSKLNFKGDQKVELEIKTLFCSISLYIKE